MNGCAASPFRLIFRSCLLMMVLLLGGLHSAARSAEESLGTEARLRLIVEASAARDPDTLSPFMSHDANA